MCLIQYLLSVRRKHIFLVAKYIFKKCTPTYVLKALQAVARGHLNKNLMHNYFLTSRRYGFHRFNACEEKTILIMKEIQGAKSDKTLVHKLM